MSFDLGRTEVQQMPGPYDTSVMSGFDEAASKGFDNFVSCLGLVSSVCQEMRTPAPKPDIIFKPLLPIG
jgi:hypothetical protein